MSKAKSGKMKDDAKRELKPKLRFPEFRDAAAWSPFPGNELFEQISNKDAPKGLPILAITQEHGAIPRDQIDYHVSATEKSVESYKEVKKGDFIISLRSFQGGIEYSEYHGICSPAYVILRRAVEGSDQFFKQFFKTNRFIRQLTKNLEGIRDGKMISYKQFSEVQLFIPKTDEQQKIADCLSSLDELIAAHSRKLDALKAHKKGLMQQLFPREGETLPRLRFPEFKEEWKEPSLDDLCVSVSSGKDKRDADGSFDLYGSTGIIGRTGKPSFDGTRILVARVGANAGFLTKTSGQYGVTDNTLVVSPKPSANIDYLYHYLGSININKLIFGSGQPLITGKVLKNLRIPLPTDQEQKKVADCLSTVDDLIEAQGAKVEFLNDHKKGLVQQLFPSLDGGAA